MKCGGCSASVKRILLSKPGIEQAAVNLLTESAVVKLRPGQSSAAEAADLLTSKALPSIFSACQTSEEGMQDSAEASEQRKREELQRSLWDLSLSWGLVLVCCTHHLGHWLHGLGWHGLAHGPVLNALANPSVSLVLGSVALLGPGRPLIQDGLVSLARGNPNMNSLIGLGALTSFAAGVAAPLVPGMAFDASFLEEPVMLLAFVLLGRTLEARARLKASGKPLILMLFLFVSSSDLRSLAKLIPADTRLVIDAGTAPGAAAAAKAAEGKGDAALVVMSVPTTSVRAGDVLRVLPGERVPVDGEILEGRCSVDESMLTGEAALVVKAQGSLVTAGTVVFEAPITVRASSTGAGSMLAGIGRLVAAAQAREAPVQRLADTIAGRFCFSVMAASAATFAFWSTLGASLFPSALDSVAGGGALLLGTKLAIDVLVVACPCALGLATPTAVLVASSMGAKRGLLLRGGDVLERIAQVDTVVFDKTGTLTEGRLRLEASSPAEGVSKTELLRWAAAAESSARHPLAAAVLAAADAAGVEVPGSRDASTEPGSGVRATVDGARVFVGHREWVEQQLREVSGSGHTDGHSSDRTHSHLTGDEAEQGMSMVHVAVEGRGLVGSLAFRDTLRPDARAVVQRLKDLNIRVALLSGDNAATVTAAAQQAGIQADSAWSGMRPEQKAAVVEQLRAGGAVVAMVGDGVNDAPALAAADVGLAMSGGMDAAGEAASVVLLGDRMGQVVEAIVLGRATLGKIRQNLAWALMYNIIGIPLAAGALLPSMGIALNASAAGGMMAFSSLAVVSNSLLLRTHPLGEAADGAAAREPQTRLHSDARQEFGSGGAPAQ
ncbi:heavy metal translocatin [Coccomyxa subellipsoidea C-169]|uniref:Heavy metal translocatin n=1 Tax=Coccomyxa subellipsoidea (strain C-169) TaxID=574566 RepID=I0Z482_COCSC|nr:heavy metal translocatin [Coccomyxa subellipsoidea C-169]EIE25451.1 heavy metal translocatin [Coccomyxa subellipsoidea C-169]|eukprot:XP_005649995.1 heavy metal translocatin [Coccomyxa subellipsoidea C-169]